MVRKNYLIINKKARPFSEMRVAGKTAVFIGENGGVLDYGVLPLDDSVYTILCCDEVQLLMLVTDRHGERKVTGIIWKDEADYASCKAVVASVSDKRISKQDLKISNYAWSVAEKLDNGVRIRVTDALDTSDMEVCPECGMLNPKGSPYCLDCGAEI